MNNAIRLLLSKMDILVFRESFYLNQCLAGVEAQQIGLAGGAEAIAYYLKNHELLHSDYDLCKFMEFYARNIALSSSQWSQDIFVMFASEMKQEGFFLEIGGADGYTHSNTYSLEKYLGWRGILIEPDPSQFKQLSISRPNNTLIHAAISPADKEEALVLRRVGQYSALQGHEGEDMHLETRLNSSSFAKVKGISLSKILAETKIDYFSLDVEGAELSILNSVNWNEVNKPKIITVEHNFRDVEKHKILSLLTALGYTERFAGYDWLRRGDIWATLQE